MDRVKFRVKTISGPTLAADDDMVTIGTYKVKVKRRYRSTVRTLHLKGTIQKEIKDGILDRIIREGGNALADRVTQDLRGRFLTSLWDARADVFAGGTRGVEAIDKIIKKYTGETND